MLWKVFFGLIILSFLIYLYYLIRFYLGLKKPKKKYNFQKKFVSVVIAARNEEKMIGKLLTILMNQSYPKALYEVIVADDNSSDKTATIIQRFSEKWENVKLISIQNREKVNSAKKNALTQAIAASEGEIILTTDADCVMSQYWIESMVAYFAENDLVAGFSRTKINSWKKESLLAKFEHFDFLAMFAAAAGAISDGKAFSCSGQNLAYKKSAFEDVEGFSKIAHLVSGDDVNLMQMMRKKKKKIGFNFSSHNFVFTTKIQSWQELINQRSRWASNMKWQLTYNPEFFLYLSSVFIVTISPFFLVFVKVEFALLILLLRIFCEYKFLESAYQIFHEEKKRLAFYPIWLIIQPFYIFIISFFGMMNIFHWKK